MQVKCDRYHVKYEEWRFYPRAAFPQARLRFDKWMSFYVQQTLIKFSMILV